MTNAAAVMPKRTAASSPQHLPSATTVLLRRRWRADHALMRTLLVLIRADRGLLGEYARAELRGKDRTISVKIVMTIATTASLAGSLAATLALIAIVPLRAPTVLALCGVVTALAGWGTGLGAWRRSGTDPFAALVRLAPIAPDRWASVLERVELSYAFRVHGVAWMLPGILAGAVAGSSLGVGAAGFLVIPPILAFAGAVFALSSVAGARAGIWLAGVRARRRAGLGRLLLAMLLSGGAALSAAATVTLFIVPLLAAARAAFRRPSALVDQAAWNVFLEDADVQLGQRFDGAVVAAQHVPWLVLGIAVSAAMVLAAAAVVVHSRPSLIETAPETVRADGDAIAAALALVRRRLDGSGGYALVYFRRMQQHGWLLAQRFWSRVLPSPEASVHLGITGAFARAADDAATATMLLGVGIVFAIHAQATEMRAELSPISSMSADRAALPLLLQAPSARGVRTMVRVRSAVLRLQTWPSSVVALLVASVLAAADGLPPVTFAMLAAITIATTIAAPLVQWYMGPLLVAETASERATEHWEDSAAASLQSRFQGLPRTWLVVLPAYGAVATVLLAEHLPAAVPWALGTLLVLGHLAALPVLARISRALERRLHAQGLDATALVR